VDVLLHNLHGSLPVTTHAANAFLVPDVIPLAFDYGVDRLIDAYRPFYDSASRHGDVILVFSEHTKRDFVARVGGSPDVVRVAPLAAGPYFRPVEDRRRLAESLAPLGLADVPYILMVATVEARKNHAVLLRAFAQMLERDQALPHRLVLVGTKWIGHEAVFDLASRLRLNDRVTYLGYVDRLEALYAGADAFVFPSLYEGFGLPPLEAMASGVPVLAANCSSLPEVVADAGILFAPNDVDTLRDDLHRVLVDRPFHDRLAQRGLERARNFSWERTAALWLEAFEFGRLRRTGRL
jgi:glycosyltransferase involved in cell wall biosynthesis